MVLEKLTEGRTIPGGAMIDLTMSHEGRRLSATTNALAARIKRDETQFGLTPVASQPVESVVVPDGRLELVGGWDPVDVALCGPDDSRRRASQTYLKFSDQPHSAMRRIG